MRNLIERLNKIVFTQTLRKIGENVLLNKRNELLLRIKQMLTSIKSDKC